MASELTASEHSTLILPYECLNRTFRNAQKVFDREISHVNASNESLKKLSSNNVGEAKQILDEALNKLELLRKRSSDAISQEEERLATCNTRIVYLKHQASAKKNLIWKRNRLDRMLVDYFLRSGNYEAAMQLAENSAIKDCVDLDMFIAARDIEHSLREKNIELCLQWCHGNKTKLKKLQSSLEVNIRIQEFVELIKNNHRVDAITYARKHFNSGGTLTAPKVQTTVMALLAFKPGTSKKKYQELFDDSRWNLLNEQFRRDNFAIHQLNSQSMLEIVLQCGLASMKTPHCFHGDEQCQDCPVCCRLFNELAKPLPFAHSSQSRLLCGISGERMNEHNHPLMLPNGNVYGEKSLVQMAALNGENKVLCPKSNQEYSIHEAKKIYIM